jgi:hypothetical protein
MRNVKNSRAAGVAGIVFAVLLVAAVPFILNFPEASDSDKDIRDFYNDDTNHWLAIIGAYAWVFAALAFLWFAGHLRGLLRATGRDSGLVFAATSAGVVFSAALVTATAAMAAVSGAILFGDVDPDQLGPDAIRVFPQFGFGLLLIGGGLSASFLIAATTLISWRSSLFPAWLNWLGVVAAIALLGGPLFLPIVALPIWVLATSIVLLTRAEPAASAG